MAPPPVTMKLFGQEVEIDTLHGSQLVKASEIADKAMHDANSLRSQHKLLRNSFRINTTARPRKFPPSGPPPPGFVAINPTDLTLGTQNTVFLGGSTTAGDEYWAILATPEGKI